MNKKISIWLIAIFSLFALKSQAQNLVLVTGTVKSGKDREIIPGVGVKLKGTNSSATTNSEGKFTIGIPDGKGTLVFTYIGLKAKEVEVNGQRSLEVLLDDDVSTLGEVVIVGYGEQSRSTVTNSITRVDAKEFENAPAANPLTQLQGKVAGLSLQVSSGQPGASPQIFIRGGASTSPEGDSPLFIVDGIVGNMRNIG
ncbi:MAG: carboxypeptidase-like regulatory domain-containing protein, partial [Bacteroidia bacterium]